MGNCLTCFKSSSSSSAASATTATSSSADKNTAYGNVAEKTTIIEQNRFCTVVDDRLERDETDVLLSRSPILHLTAADVAAAATITTTESGGAATAGASIAQSAATTGSLKKPIAHINGSAAMGDIITTNVKEHQVSDNTLNALFEEYKDPQEDCILSEGIERLCNDLGYNPDDFAILVLAWRLDASQMCRFTKLEFIQGLQELNADTIDEIRVRLEQIVEKLKSDSDMFKQLYRFTFRFGLETDHRTVSLDMAIILWRLVFTVHTPQILERWLFFLDKHPDIRGVPKDTWNMFLNFAETCDITSYDDTEAWPSLFDDFVEYETDRANQNVKETTNSSATTITISTTATTGDEL